MTTEIAFVLAVATLAFAAFATERFRVDQVAIALPVVLLAGGVIDREQAVAGFSNTATVTVAAMLVLSLGLVKTGAVAAIGSAVSALPWGGPGARTAVLCGLAALVSPFLNNTAVVVVLLPLFLAEARRAGRPPSLYLLPLSFSAILGGTVTMIGTSTNLVVHGLARARGFDELGIFSIAPLGLVYLLVGGTYLATVGRRLLPARPGHTDLGEKYGMRRFAAELRVAGGSGVVGRTLRELDWGRRIGLWVGGIGRGRAPLDPPTPDRPLRAGDVLQVQGDSTALLELAGQEGLATAAEGEEGGRGTEPDAAPAAREEPPAPRFVELLVVPGAPIENRTLAEVRFQQRYGASVVALQRHGVTLRERLAGTRLAAGDLLLVQGPAPALEALAGERGFVPLGEIAAPGGARPRAPFALGVLALVVSLAASGLVDILPAALLGVVLMVFSGCLSMDEIYRELDWMVVFLLAGLIPLGIAMDESGTAAWIVAGTAGALRDLPAPIAVGAFYLVTSLLTEILSNNAAALVLTPVAILTAEEIGVSPYALLVAVMFGASASFMTPTGYQTNTLVYGPGGYRFGDYFRVGAPLNFLLLVVASLLIPWFWPAPAA